MEKMMRQIVPCRLEIEDIQSTWKLGQNKPDDVRLWSADQVERHEVGLATAMLARLMREVGP
jgi:transcriptional regulator